MAAEEALQSALPPQLPPLPELRFARVDARHRSLFEGERLSYMEAGPTDGPPILLLHGLTANSMYWRHQYAALCETHRVIGWNAPGYMLSDPLRNEKPSAVDYARALGAFMDALDIAEVFLGASSFGSAVAQAFAAREPARVARMAFCGTVYNERPVSDAEQLTFLRARKSEIAHGPMGLADGVGALFGPRAAGSATAVMRGVVPATNVNAYMQVANCLAKFSAEMASPSDISAPLLLVQGADDRIRPAEANAIALMRAKPDAKLVVLEGIGHLPEVEDPARVNALMLAFFNGGVTSFAGVSINEQAEKGRVQ